MADTTQVSVTDLSRLQRTIEATAAGITMVNAKTDALSENVVRVDRKVEIVRNDLAKLQADFKKFVKEQKNANNLQFAATEIVRVRQELDTRFGKHADSRIRLRGILDSTDAGLLREHTIHSCSEQIMLDTPKYWLAPCLVALAAWISNEQGLAEKAVTEAIRRDATKTSLLFALICRRTVPAEKSGKDKVRAARMQACFNWLGAYFRTQNPLAMSDSVIVVVDAWANDVFGKISDDPKINEDKDNICRDTFRDWMKTIKKETPLEENQKKEWKEFFASQAISTASTYSQLAAVAPEFPAADAYLARINSADPIQQHFDKIRNAPVDTKGLIDRLDDQLNNLISEFDEEEEELRADEKHFDLIKQFKGDEYAATTAELRILGKKHSEVANFAERLEEAVRSDDPKFAAARKTAIRSDFLGEYIQSSYEEYITEKKKSFPQEITIQHNSFAGWKGSSRDGKNGEELKKSYAAHMNKKREEAVAAVDRGPAKKNLVIFSIIGIVALLVLGFAVNFIVGIVAGAAFVAIGFVKFNNANKAADAKVAQINANYDKAIQTGSQLIVVVLGQWQEVLTRVANFAAVANKKEHLNLEVAKQKEA